MDIFEFIQKHDVDHAAYLITKEDLRLAEREMGGKVGPQLSTYLLEYGYLGFESAEFYGINARQGLESDMVRDTIFLHRYFPETAPYFVFENADDGAYVLVDSDDNVLFFISEDGMIEDLGQKLNEYMLKRFESELEMDEDMK